MVEELLTGSVFFCLFTALDIEFGYELFLDGHKPKLSLRELGHCFSQINLILLID